MPYIVANQQITRHVHVSTTLKVYIVHGFTQTLELIQTANNSAIATKIQFHSSMDQSNLTGAPPPDVFVKLATQQTSLELN